ncbi:MAG: aminotransferase class I/II-fold pyridoxal phosphate-dependent enzyme [Ferruginibacter sp.]|nr:aminotransferase class I/II-fold pyridoxal phosphate-dependent enzyme [Cytophagales bacterium]
MSSQSVSRRNWLKSSTMIAAGLTMGTTKWAELQARPAETFVHPLADLPVIKARLSSNENPFGPSEKAKKAITEALPDSYLYPREHLMKFRKMIAQEEGVSEDHIMLGAGSGELLVATAICYAFKNGAGSHVLSADPSYMQLVRASTNIGIGWEKVPLNKAYDYDFSALSGKVTDKTSLVYICNPNNPTGIVTDPQQLAAFCESVSKTKPIFVDEAYIDYTANPKKVSMVECIRKGQNVMIARTFSKVHSFAGLRIGYLIAQPDVIKEIAKFGTSGSSISSTSVRGAIASYGDQEFIKYSVAKNNESKEFLYKLLKENGYTYLPSQTNFVLFPLKMDGKRFVDEMMKRGVSIRSWVFDDKQWCRVSMGTMDQMKAFAEAFKQLA